MPEYKIERLQIAGRSDAIIEMNTTNNFHNSSSLKKSLETKSVLTEEESRIVRDRYLFQRIIYTSIEYILSPHNMEMKIFMLTMLIMMILMFVYFSAQVREFKQSSSSGFIKQSNTNLGIVTALAEELPDGSTRVGKIVFDPNEILGKGCEGTFVFKGEFDNRKVAVKRLLPECFTVADREVCLLRESDQHPNVIRYFCMEQDKQFRYIALELCSATLQDYTENGILNDCITSSEALLQAVCGLEHLHSLHIVHRDIKPHNILLSFPSSKKNRVRAMISDFGLCKKLQTGKASFSRKSGITGTEGWIAPEIIHGKSRSTTAVDVFSMGCVFYYVLSKGKHPFGNSINRQANIMNGDYNLNEISGDTYHLWTHLICKMVSLDPTERPSINVVKKHPSFWTKERILLFLQDVSDRIEKEEITSRVLVELETGNSFVLTLPDWRDMIEQEIAEDLRKYRTYRHDSVRDLLRALRNKKHHYRELSDRVRDIFGSIPDKFVQYWMDRFPKLVLHTWLAMQCVNHEDVFQKYYCNGYTFPRVHDGVTPVWIQHALNSSPRWRLPGRPLVTRFGNNSRSGPFASLYTNGRGQEYTWRQRNKIIGDVGFPADDYNVTAKISLETESAAVNDIDASADTVEMDDEDVTCRLQDDLAVIGDYEQENVEPENEANDSSGEVQLKTGKIVRHRRGRNRNRKKLCDASSMLSKSMLPAE